MAWCRDSCSINYYENKQKLASVIHFVSLAKHKWGVIKTLGEQVYKNQKPYVLNLSSSCLGIFHSIQTGSSTAAPPPRFQLLSESPSFQHIPSPEAALKVRSNSKENARQFSQPQQRATEMKRFTVQPWGFSGRTHTHTHPSILDHWPILAPNNSFSWKWKWPSKHIQISYHLILQTCCCSLVI